MSRVFRKAGHALAVGVAVAWLSAAGDLHGQTRGGSASAATRRTPWGHPDLQGNWTNTTTTPLERPTELAAKGRLSEAERKAADEEAEKNRDRKPPPGQTGAYNDVWFERGRRSEQTSLIIEPENGRLPPLTTRGQARMKELLANRVEDGGRPPDSYEDFDVYDRCISRALPGAMMPGFYNHNYKIIQTPTHVLIYVEMIHDARIIPLDKRPHVSSKIRQWLGDPRGHWEGDVLVVESKYFKEGADERGMANTVVGGSPEMVIVERFKRIDEDTLDYRFTVTDPVLFTAPWTVSAPMTKLDGEIFEYACHEGNYSMPNMLKGARADEQNAKEKK